MPLIHAQTPRVNAIAGGRFGLAAKAAVKNFAATTSVHQHPPGRSRRKVTKTFYRPVCHFVTGFQNIFISAKTVA
jgi:hypothetical protein